MSTEETLKQRGSVHGDFADNSQVMVELLTVMMRASGWARLSPVARVALIYIAGKVSRILAGDPNFADHWHDIQGYAKCVEDRLVTRLEVPKTTCPHCFRAIPKTLPGDAQGNVRCPGCDKCLDNYINGG